MSPLRSRPVVVLNASANSFTQNSQHSQNIGPVALIRSGSGTVVGTANLSNVIKLTRDLCSKNAKKMGMTKSEALTCVGEYAWELENVVQLKKPVPYKHPPGAITWVTLDEATTKKVLAEAKRSS